MNKLHLSVIESEALIQRAAFCNNDWTLFSSSVIWVKIKQNMNFVERNHFRKCWETL